MELVIGQNSYMSLDEANRIVEDELLEDSEEYKVWNSLSDNDKIKLIVKGTRVVDKLPFLGYITESYGLGSLHWPRYINNKLIECPLDIKLGVIKQSLKDYINKDKQETKLLELGVKSYSIKSASITMSDKSTMKMSVGINNDIFEEYLSKWVY